MKTPENATRVYLIIQGADTMQKLFLRTTNTLITRLKSINIRASEQEFSVIGLDSALHEGVILPDDHCRLRVQVQEGV